MSDPNGDSAPFRAQVERVLDSPEFAGSHRVSDFLRYICQAALDGRTEIDQAEIAKEVLGRDTDFDPLEDAYVRKLATAARQRLERYYSGRGKQDPILIHLPQRSYVPRFRFIDQPPPAIKESPEPTRNYPRRIALAAVTGLLVLALCGLAVFVWRSRASGGVAPVRFVLAARKGNIITTRTDAPPECVRLGPTIGTTDQFIARMVFSPRIEGDHAGIMIYDNADNYVKFGRYLRRRTDLHFAAEVRGGHSLTPASFHYDMGGQTEEPIWMAIRRNGQEFKAFTSPDGHQWQQIGQMVRAPLSASKARVAVYAFSDADEVQPPSATFDHLSYGPAVATWGDSVPPLSALDGWEESNNCISQATVVQKSDMTEISFAEDPARCRWNLLRKAPAGDWSVTTVVDSPSWARTFSGIFALGDKDRLNAVRSNVGGGSVVVASVRQQIFRRPDFPGSPPLVFRLRCTRGKLTVKLGTALDSLEELPVRSDLGTLGDGVKIGFASGRGIFQSDLALAPVALRFLGMDVLELHNYR